MQKILYSLVCTLLLAAQAHAAGSEAPCYALLSLIGDKLDIVFYQPQTGSSIESNRHEVLPIDDPLFDNTAVSAAGDAVRKLVPAAALVALNSRSPALFARQHEFFDDQDAAVALPDAIRAALKKESATHLILITKHRGDATIAFQNLYDGSGKLEGLGYYIDGATRTNPMPGEGGETRRGYLAPYAYMKVSLIDAQTSKVMGKQIVKASQALSAAGVKESASPWDAMTNQQKVRTIDQMIRREITRMVLELLAARDKPRSN
jgi:hypothetical protein